MAEERAHGSSAQRTGTLPEEPALRARSARLGGRRGSYNCRRGGGTLDPLVMCWHMLGPRLPCGELGEACFLRPRWRWRPTRSNDP